MVLLICKPPLLKSASFRFFFLEGLSDQFDKYGWKTIDDLGVSYDYQSIMHYDRMAFTKNGRPTIVAIGNENMDFKTPNFKLSTRDALEINALYDCHKSKYLSIKT